MSRTSKRPYTKSKRFDKTCRNNGSCPYCKNNRLHNFHREGQRAMDQIKEQEIPQSPEPPEKPEGPLAEGF
jgi:hypothetical protein